MPRPATGQVVERDGKRGLSYALRVRAYGKRRYITLGSAADGWTAKRAEQELENVLADVRRGIWRPPEPEPNVEPKTEPTFHEVATRWLLQRTNEVEARTVESWRWALEIHLLHHFAAMRPSEITPSVVRGYRAAKLAEAKPLSATSINKTLKTLAQVLDDAVEDGFIESNPARGKKTRLKASKPRRTWLELDEVRALLDAAGEHRALLATMILAGLRVGELCELRWRDVNLASGRLTVEEAKTDAGERVVDVSPLLLDELKAHRAGTRFDVADDFVFVTRAGTKRNRSNVRSRVLQRAIEKADAKLAEAGKPTIQPGVTNHTCRRTFASLLYEAGASPAYVMQQMGHASSSLALEIYTKVMERKRDTGTRMDALIRGADWAQTGTNGAVVDDALANVATEEAD